VRFSPFQLRKQAAKAVTAMFTRIVCPSCGHVGATAMSLPRVLICSQCGHRAVIKSGTPTRSPILTREERAAERAARERYEAADARADARAKGTRAA
jgi:DNA-directed RNA polymerase subunit RPC12/RpoP